MRYGLGMAGNRDDDEGGGDGARETAASCAGWMEPLFLKMKAKIEEATESVCKTDVTEAGAAEKGRAPDRRDRALGQGGRGDAAAVPERQRRGRDGWDEPTIPQTTSESDRNCWSNTSGSTGSWKRNRPKPTNGQELRLHRNHARLLKHQIKPADLDLRTWLLLGGRGSGKTFAGSVWIDKMARDKAGIVLALVGPALHDVREVMVEGASGIKALAEPGDRPRWEAGAASAGVGQSVGGLCVFGRRSR